MGIFSYREVAKTITQSLQTVCPVTMTTVGAKKGGEEKRKAEGASVALLVCSAICGVTLGVGLYFWNRVRRRNPYLKPRRTASRRLVTMTVDHAKLLDEYRAKCAMSEAQLNLLVEDFLARMGDGLEREGEMLKMLPSYVERMPCGEESGEFLAIDLGGTNLS